MSEVHFQESIDTFKVRFEGGSSIDAELFIRIINNTIDLVKASAQAIDPGVFLRLEIKANKEGSFETVIDAVAKYTTSLLSSNNIRLACEIVGGYLSFLQIKSHLKGYKPKSISTTKEGTTIINQDDEKITVSTSIVNCYFNNSTIDNSIVQIFTDLQEKNKEGMAIEHGSQKKVFKRADYQKMSIPALRQDQQGMSKQVVENIKDCCLIIKKPDLIGRSKWEVIFAGRVINVKIDDEKFLYEIRQGLLKVSGGSGLICDLKINAETDEELNILSAEHTVIKVHGIKGKQDLRDFFEN